MKKDWCNFPKLLNDAKYWEMPTNMNDSGRDGSKLGLEGVKENNYHIVDR